MLLLKDIGLSELIFKVPKMEKCNKDLPFTLHDTFHYETVSAINVFEISLFIHEPVCAIFNSS